MTQHLAQIWTNPGPQTATVICTAHDAEHQRQCGHYRQHPDHHHPKHGVRERYRWCRWNYLADGTITDECRCPAIQQAMKEPAP